MAQSVTCRKLLAAAPDWGMATSTKTGYPSVSHRVAAPSLKLPRLRLALQRLQSLVVGSLSCKQRRNSRPCDVAGPKTIYREKPTLPAVMGLKQ